MYTFLLCNYTSTVSALALTLALALSLLSHYNLTSSNGFFLWSLRTMPMLFRSCMASTFSWWWSLSSCFCANLWISLDKTSTSRSLWRSLFLMYQGAMTMFRSTLFWNHCMMSMLLCLVQPHNWIPYVQMGFSICLYRSSLLWRDSEELNVNWDPNNVHKVSLTWFKKRPDDDPVGVETCSHSYKIK